VKQESQRRRDQSKPSKNLHDGRSIPVGQNDLLVIDHDRFEEPQVSLKGASSAALVKANMFVTKNMGMSGVTT